MKIKTLVFLGVLNFILSSTILQLVRINGAMPNLCIIFSILILVHYDARSAFVFAGTNAVLQDIFLGRMLGVQLIAYFAIIFYAVYIVEMLFKGNYLTPIFLVSTGTVLYHMVQFVIYFFFQMSIPLSIVGPRIITEIVYNCVLGFILYAFIFKRINGYKLGDYNA